MAEPIQDDIGLRRFIEDGCSARPEDKHDALAALDRLVAERDRLKEKADYWERQYVIESENADDFHAERDRLQEALTYVTSLLPTETLLTLDAALTKKSEA